MNADMEEIRDLRQALAGLRERLENLAAGMELSAAVTSPSRKSEIERECAAAVLGIAASITVATSGEDQEQP